MRIEWKGKNDLDALDDHDKKGRNDLDRPDDHDKK